LTAGKNRGNAYEKPEQKASEILRNLPRSAADSVAHWQWVTDKPITAACMHATSSSVLYTCSEMQNCPH